MGILTRYAALLPVTPATPPVNLEEGSTPLIALPRIGEKLGITLYGKFEGCNPSGSFKDKGNSPYTLTNPFSSPLSQEIYGVALFSGLLFLSLYIQRWWLRLLLGLRQFENLHLG